MSLLSNLLDLDETVLEELMKRCDTYMKRAYLDIHSPSHALWSLTSMDCKYTKVMIILFVMNNEEPFKDMILSSSSNTDKDGIFLSLLSRKVESFLNNTLTNDSSCAEQFVKDCRIQYLLC